jgi:hypothetical protein
MTEKTSENKATSRPKERAADPFSAGKNYAFGGAESPPKEASAHTSNI